MMWLSFAASLPTDNRGQVNRVSASLDSIGFAKIEPVAVPISLVICSHYFLLNRAVERQ